MPTLEENIRKIRGEAIYGRDIRTAIADGIEQMDDSMVSRINTYTGRLTSVENTVNTRTLFFNCNSIGNGNYQLEIINASS